MLAHCVEDAEFPELPAETARLPRPWAVHQVQTTVDFARGNRLLTWYVGGLNFQSSITCSRTSATSTPRV